MNCDGNSLYPSAMWDDNSVCPKIESGYAFKTLMNETFVEAFDNQTYSR